jgi:hypothetical protein
MDPTIFPTKLLLSRIKSTWISGQYRHMECGVTWCLHLPDVPKYMLIICYDFVSVIFEILRVFETILWNICFFKIRLLQSDLPATEFHPWNEWHSKSQTNFLHKFRQIISVNICIHNSTHPSTVITHGTNFST